MLNYDVQASGLWVIMESSVSLFKLVSLANGPAQPLRSSPLSWQGGVRSLGGPHGELPLPHLPSKESHLL